MSSIATNGDKDKTPPDLQARSVNDVSSDDNFGSTSATGSRLSLDSLATSIALDLFSKRLQQMSLQAKADELRRVELQTKQPDLVKSLIKNSKKTANMGSTSMLTLVLKQDLSHFPAIPNVCNEIPVPIWFKTGGLFIFKVYPLEHEQIFHHQHSNYSFGTLDAIYYSGPTF